MDILKLPSLDPEPTEPQAGALEVPCANHPAVASTRRCHLCSQAICSTCDFTFPGEIHLCPGCATQPRHRMSPSRLNRVRWGVGLAIWSTVSLIGMFILVAGATPSEQEAIGGAAGLLSLVPAIIGLGLGFSCRKKRGPNPVSVGVAILGNALILAIWFLLILIGNLES